MNQNSAKKNITILSFNIAHGMGMDGIVDLEKTAKIIESSNADIIGLQEVDRYFGERSGFIDQVEWLEKRLGMNAAYGPNLNYKSKDPQKPNEQYGNAVFSKFPIKAIKNHLLKLEGELFCGDEQRGILEVVLEIEDKSLTLFNAHLALGEEEKTSNIEELMKLALETEKPRILIGDFNALSNSSHISQLKAIFTDVFEETGLGDCYTFPSPYKNNETGQEYSPFMRIDYILADTQWIVEHTSRIVTDVSDHLPILAKFVLKD